MQRKCSRMHTIQHTWHKPAYTDFPRPGLDKSNIVKDSVNKSRKKKALFYCSAHRPSAGVLCETLGPAHHESGAAVPESHCCRHLPPPPSPHNPAKGAAARPVPSQVYPHIPSSCCLNLFIQTRNSSTGHPPGGVHGRTYPCVRGTKWDAARPACLSGHLPLGDMGGCQGVCLAEFFKSPRREVCQAYAGAVLQQCWACFSASFASLSCRYIHLASTE